LPDTLSSDDVRHIARLARLRLTPEETERMRSQLSDILAHFQSLADVDTEGVEPTGHALEAHSIMREDESRPSLLREQVLANAPHPEGEFIRVKPVLE
jgi:aspartyl-tRNA(Asn)/glutamyl-tRNA(Gln) amidotransferase subunit C